ncbi:MAG: ABC transporter ATP-binding protein [Saprospiraceae bacterium]|nr:ABC transporter ATP-binding protein [Saprospiraceae bacterium]MCB9321964.1 ABC transporter ATP-binding protein [Lewinellaceae bacterium]
MEKSISSQPAVEIRQLRKTYDKGTVVAIKGLDLSVGRGELLALIGPDGAGKTSLFRILATLILPDAGQVEVLGYDVVKDFQSLRLITGYMPGRFALYQDLTVLENLSFFATVFNTTIEANYDLIKDIYVQLEPFKHRRASQLSGGMKQKLALCCTLVHKPSILLLDEPTTGVDPVSRQEFWDILSKLKDDGMTMIVSTPYMDEARRCDRIAMMDRGELLDISTPEALIHGFGKPLYAIQSDRMFALLQDLRKYPVTDTCFAFGEAHHVTFRKPIQVDDLRGYLQMQGHHHVDIAQIQPTVEDCFMDQLAS